MTKTLKELGLSREQSKDWRKLADIPEPEFEERLAEASRDPKTMTTAKVSRPRKKPVVIDPLSVVRWCPQSGPELPGCMAISAVPG